MNQTKNSLLIAAAHSVECSPAERTAWEVWHRSGRPALGPYTSHGLARENMIAGIDEAVRNILETRHGVAIATDILGN